jgi:hypothetical protein
MNPQLLAAPLAIAATFALSGPAEAASSQPVAIAAGDAVTVIGEGCRGGATVEITLGANHASGLVLASFPADGSGRFSRSVGVPSVDQPTATLVAMCTGTDGNTDIVYFADITYRTTSLALTGLESARLLLLTAAGLIALGAVALCRPSHRIRSRDDRRRSAPDRGDLHAGRRFGPPGARRWHRADDARH